MSATENKLHFKLFTHLFLYSPACYLQC